MIERFFAHLGRAKSINALNLAIIDGLNVMTPTEVVSATQAVHREGWRFPGELPQEKVEEFTQTVRAALGQSVRVMSNAGKPRPEYYIRDVPMPGIWFYSGGGSRERSTLIVAFPGNGGRLMMPIPLILQHLPAKKIDLLLVPDNHRATYSRGIPPLGDKLEDALVHLKEHLPREYRRMVTLGTSSGGIPALLAASTLGADTALAVGAGHPDDERWMTVRPTSKRQLLEAAAPGLAGCRVTLAFGAQSPEDAVSVEEIRRIVPNARPLCVSIPGVEVKHVALFPLTEQGKLRPFLEEQLGLMSRGGVAK